jgi:hypothetical protein
MSKVLIEFTKDFANKKKGDTMELDSMVASTLIRENKAKKRVRKPSTKEDK